MKFRFTHCCPFPSLFQCWKFTGQARVSNHLTPVFNIELRGMGGEGREAEREETSVTFQTLPRRLYTSACLRTQQKRVELYCMGEKETEGDSRLPL